MKLVQRKFSKTAFRNNDIQTCESVEEIVINILDHHASLKKFF